MRTEVLEIAAKVGANGDAVNCPKKGRPHTWVKTAYYMGIQ